jgi:Mg2+/citrate symporter
MAVTIHLWSKPIYQSKTFWVNLLGSIATITGMLSGVLPPKYAAIAVGVQGTVNIWLRFLTSEPVSVKGV